MDKKEKRTKKIRKKLLHKYRLVVLNEDTFEERFSFKLNRLNVFVFSTIFAVFLITFTTFLIAFTPLREYIPGYSSTSLKQKATDLTFKADSLQQVLVINEQYLASIRKVLTGDVKTVDFNKDSILEAALKNGMTSATLFEQLKNIRESVTIPLIIMGYFNPVLQYGVEAFCKKCKEIGIDGLILPDLPVDVYDEQYKAIFEKYGLINVFLITPQTSDQRIQFIDSVSNGFIYMVSSASTTGAQTGFGDTQADYFKRIADMQLKNPQIVGFGISNKETFTQATQNAKGAIIGSAFIKHLTTHGVDTVDQFVQPILAS